MIYGILPDCMHNELIRIIENANVRHTCLSIIGSLANTNCILTTLYGANSQPTYYNITCSSVCNKWLLYILDFSPPLPGMCSTENLPCLLDTNSRTGGEYLNKALGSTFIKKSGTLGVNPASLDTVLMFARCISANCQSNGSYSDGVMLRIQNQQELASVYNATPTKPISTSRIQPTVTASLSSSAESYPSQSPCMPISDRIQYRR